MSNLSAYHIKVNSHKPSELTRDLSDPGCFTALEPERFYMSVAIGGKLVELKREEGIEIGRSQGGGLRSEVEGYSKASRNRFLKTLLAIDYEKMGPPMFYTLTYPGQYSSNPADWKRDLHTFVMRLKRAYPDMCGTWRLEPQERGAPHFAGFLWGCPDLAGIEGKERFSRMWYEVVGSGDKRHLKAGTGIELEAMIDRRILYLAKYQTKEEKGGLRQEFAYKVGRYWGVFNRERIAIRKERMELDPALYFRIRRVMRKNAEKKMRRKRSLQVDRGSRNGMWWGMSDKDVFRLVDLFTSDDSR